MSQIRGLTALTATMTTARPFSSGFRGGFPLAVLSLFAALVGCNAKVATVLESTNSDAASTTTPPSSGAPCATDPECNDDPAVSALYGTCTSGTCVCSASFELKSSGKCGPQTTPTTGTGTAGAVCTFGQDQTCNDAIEMSALAGHCNADSTCTCNPNYAKKSSGKCGAPSTPTNPTSFPDYVEGTWMIGWSGGLEHYSWVHLQGHDQGEARFLSKSSTSSSAVTSYWSCTGVGSWAMTQKPNTIFLYFPASCSTTGIRQAYTFQTVTPNPQFPSGALLGVDFEHQPTEQAMNGYKFAEGTCNAAFTSCTDPFPF